MPQAPPIVSPTMFTNAPVQSSQAAAPAPTPISTAVASLVSAVNPFQTAPYLGANLLGSQDVEFPLTFNWHIASIAQDGTITAPPAALFLNLQTVPKVVDALARFTLLNYKKIEILIMPPYNSSLDCAVALVPAENQPATPTAVHARNIIGFPTAVPFYFRANITTPQSSYLEIPNTMWPISTSLRSAGHGLSVPHLVFAHVVSGTTTSAPSNGIHAVVRLTVVGSGRGYVGLGY